MADTYTTSQGEMWDSIAKKLLGNELFLDQLLKANPDQAETVFFSAGIVLNIPEISKTTVNYPRPPWA